MISLRSQPIKGRASPEDAESPTPHYSSAMPPSSFPHPDPGETWQYQAACASPPIPSASALWDPLARFSLTQELSLGTGWRSWSVLEESGKLTA